MKKLIFLAVAFTAVYFADGQKISTSKVPASIKAAYMKEYPTAKNAKWEIENGLYEASFKSNGHNVSALFDKNGKMSESEVDIKISELPSGAVSYVKEHYKSSIKEASKITKTNGEVNYEANVNHKDVIFDAKGKFIREAKE
jgi:hypothetical protein